MTIHSKVSPSILFKMSNNLFDDLGTLLDLLVRTILLCKTHLALALKTPLLEHLLSFLVLLQARYVAELELSVGGDIGLRSKDHHVANVGTAYKWIAAMIYIRSAYPDTDATRIFILEVIRSVATLPMECVSKARESECIIDDSMLNESTVVGIVNWFPQQLG